MNNYEITRSTLQAQLTNFGLNPTEWSLQRIQSFSYLIQHRSDKNFALRGQLEFRKNRPRWKSLEVLSI